MAESVARGEKQNLMHRLIAQVSHLVMVAGGQIMRSHRARRRRSGANDAENRAGYYVDANDWSATREKGDLSPDDVLEVVRGLDEYLEPAMRSFEPQAVGTQPRSAEGGV
ncbi:hypothetical protein AB0J90_16810 [Micromonospora sp. NPDC049523]|uniref:hypothetical protein n=1 Tax=Micromonospora sp. NPDC049523 TaxID=3155921 RepID=UPI003417FF11